MIDGNGKRGSHRQLLLRGLRNLEGLSQAELARRVERSQRWLSLVEGGQLLPQPQQAGQLAEILGIDARTLWGDR